MAHLTCNNDAENIAHRYRENQHARVSQPSCPKFSLRHRLQSFTQLSNSERKRILRYTYSTIPTARANIRTESYLAALLRNSRTAVGLCSPLPFRPTDCREQQAEADAHLKCLMTVSKMKAFAASPSAKRFRDAQNTFFADCVLWLGGVLETARSWGPSEMPRKCPRLEEIKERRS